MVVCVRDKMNINHHATALCSLFSCFFAIKKALRFHAGLFENRKLKIENLFHSERRFGCCDELVERLGIGDRDFA